MFRLNRIPFLSLTNNFESLSNVTHVRNKSGHPFLMRRQKVIDKQKATLDKITYSNQDEIVSDMVTPHWRLSYEEELSIKYQYCKDVLSKLFEKLGTKKNLNSYLEDIIPSPIRDSYRTKDEFSVWPGLDGDPKTVGFFVGSPAVGKVVCVPPTAVKCIRESHKKLAQLYQDFIRSSPLNVSYQLFDKGFWRNIVIRSNDSGDHMALVITNPLGYTEDIIKEQQELMKEYFNRHAPSLALFHQACPHVKCSRNQAPIHHLSGNPYLMESLGNCTFRLSPDSFFQLNKTAAEIMYQAVLKVTNPKPYTTVLDLYCGAGAISLLASVMARGCVGIEEVDSAVEDATYNAQTNNATNCKFIAGKVEMELPKVLNNLMYSSDIIAVLNPGRGGANEGVVSLLRHNKHIHRVVYISCKADNPLSMKNFVQLCEKVSKNSRPFTLSKAIPIDLFPYTNHVELLLCFDRND